MTDVFISYSRKDIAFARLLHQALIENELETWIDWQDIPPSTDWLAEVYEAIEGADAFVFIISETSLSSEICGLEIAHAAKHNKRLIPIVIKDVEAEKVPKALSVLNWIFFDEAGEKFAEAMDDLVTAITVDQAWVKAHTRFQNRALTWGRKGKDPGLLLRGSDLTEAEAWLAQAAEKDPPPTALQTQYILKSREDTTRRQRFTLGAVGAGLVVAIALGIMAWTQRNMAIAESEMRATAQAEAVAEADARATEVVVRSTAQAFAEEQQAVAEEQRRIAEARLLAATALDQIESDLDLALLLSIEALKKDQNYLTIGSLLSTLEEDAHLLRHFYEHSLEITDVAFSSNGEIATSGVSDPIRLWDPLAGDQSGQTFSPESENAAQIDISPDGETLASIHWDDTVRIWDMVSGMQTSASFQVEEASFQSVAYSPQGELLAAGDSHGYIYLFQLEPRAMRHRFDTERSNKSITRLAFSAQGDLLATGGYFDEIILWDPIAGEKLLAIPTGHGDVQGLLFSPDGKMLITGGEDGEIRIWDPLTGMLQHTLSRHVGSSILTLTISPNGKYLFSSHKDNTIILWDIQARSERGVWADLGRRTYDMDISADGYYLVTSSMDDVTRLWSVYSQVSANIPFVGHSERITAMAFTPDGKYLLSGGYGDELCLWDLTTGEMVGEPFSGHEGNIASLAISPDGTMFVSGGWDNTIRFWDFNSRTPIRPPLDVGVHPTALRFNPSGDLLAASLTSASLSPLSVSSKVILWDVATMDVIADVEAEYASIDAMTFSPDGRMLAFGESNLVVLPSIDDHMIRLWDVQSGVQLGEPLIGHERAIHSLDFNDDGTMLVSTDSDGAIRFWDVESQEQIGDPLTNWADGDQNTLFIPNTDLVAISGHNDDGVIRLLDSISHQYVGGPIVGQRARGLSITFPHHLPLLGYTGHSTEITALAVAADGRWLASGAQDGSIRLWTLDVNTWMESACLRAGRNLTQEEWRIYQPYEPYEKTCPQFP